jgi:hypothetical protein
MQYQNTHDHEPVPVYHRIAPLHEDPALPHAPWWFVFLCSVILIGSGVAGTLVVQWLLR